MCYSAMVKRDMEMLGRTYGAIVIRDQFEDYGRASKVDPKRYPALDDRIFPGHYAPVVHELDHQRAIEVMRYGAYPPPTIAAGHKYTTFNARRDNLTSPFWSGAFLKHHGFVVLEAFYEWVAVEDLLAAGVVTLGQVTSEFARQAAERKAKILAQGKKYKPTPTEQLDPRQRRIVIAFRPEDGRDLVVPVIFSDQRLADGRMDHGFAIITDEPPPEVRDAGHDRCPVILEPEAAQEWMHIEGKTARQMDDVLTHRRRVSFTHALAEAA